MVAQATRDAVGLGVEPALAMQDVLAALPVFLSAEALSRLTSYVEAYEEPSSIADEALAETQSGGLVADRFRAQFGDSYSAGSQFFAYQFACRLGFEGARRANAALSDPPRLEAAVKAFLRAAVMVNDDTCAVAFDECARQISAHGGQPALAAVVAILAPELDAKFGRNGAKQFLAQTLFEPELVALAPPAKAKRARKP